MVGNHAVRSLLQRRETGRGSSAGPASGAESSPGGAGKLCSRCARRHQAGKPLDCEECEAALENAPGPVAGASIGGHPLQPRLALGSPDHPSEREAERVAHRGGRHPVRAAPPGGSGPRLDPAQASRIERARSGGTPLPHPTRAFFESRFGTDLSDVRIHTGATAARSARALGAQAYTVGSDVVFGSGQFRPGTTAGRHLLAHELTHVLQQRSGPEAVSRQLGVEEYPDCTEDVTGVADPEDRLEDARGLAIRMTDSAIDSLELAIRADRDPDQDLAVDVQEALAEHLHDPTVRQMRTAIRHLRRARRRLDLPQRMICNTAESSICREGSAGYALWGAGPYIHLCPSAFVPGQHTTLPIVLLHEALHVIGLDRDCYIWEDCYENLSSAQAVTNEDSLAFFADAVHIEIIRF